jgi:conjugative transfer signal peptidase TraF
MAWVSGNRRFLPGRGCAAAIATVAVGMAFLASGRHGPLLIFNASASAPIGFYRVQASARIDRGDLVLVRTPESVRALAAERNYLPASVPLVKRIAALPGAAVCAVGRIITIDGRSVAERLAFDREGRPLQAWSGCRKLEANEIFLLMEDAPDSFDSRYFGPVLMSAAIGRLSPLWLR